LPFGPLGNSSTLRLPVVPLASSPPCPFLVDSWVTRETRSWVELTAGNWSWDDDRSGSKDQTQVGTTKETSGLAGARLLEVLNMTHWCGSGAMAGEVPSISHQLGRLGSKPKFRPRSRLHPRSEEVKRERIRKDPMLINYLDYEMISSGSRWCLSMAGFRCRGSLFSWTRPGEMFVLIFRGIDQICLGAESYSGRKHTQYLPTYLIGCGTRPVVQIVVPREIRPQWT